MNKKSLTILQRIRLEIGWAVNMALALMSVRPKHIKARSLLELGYARGPANVIRIWNSISKSPPKHVFDCGAHKSEWAVWLKREWPKVEVYSFEPCEEFQPIGKVFRVALSDTNGTCDMVHEDNFSHAVEGSGGSTKMARLDTMWLGRVPDKSILKVDCETHTLKVLQGSGQMLSQFDMVVVELWNEFSDSQQGEIVKFILDAGFNQMRLVDYGVNHNGLIFTDAAFWRK